MSQNSAIVFFFKQKTAYEMSGDWSSDVCSSDLGLAVDPQVPVHADGLHREQDREVLPREAHRPRLRGGLELLLDNRARVPHDRDRLRGHLAEAPDREGGAGERLPLRDPDAEGPRDLADLVLVQVPEGLDAPP